MTVRVPIARAGLLPIAVATATLGILGTGAGMLYWPAAIPFAAAWLAVVWFFRDPVRKGRFRIGELCAPADGRVTEVTELQDHEAVSGPATRIGIFLSLLDVHVNRMPCTGRVRSVSYRPGRFLDARHPESGQRNESNTLVIETEAPLPGPVVLRQVAGVLARRIVCTARAGERLEIGSHVGLIRFGSRTELILPRLPQTEVTVVVGSKVRAGQTVVARQPIEAVAIPQEVTRDYVTSGQTKEPARAAGTMAETPLRLLDAGH